MEQRLIQILQCVTDNAYKETASIIDRTGTVACKLAICLLKTKTPLKHTKKLMHQHSDTAWGVVAGILYEQAKNRS